MLKNIALITSILIQPLPLIANDSVLPSLESTLTEFITIQDILTRKVRPSSKVELCPESVHKFLEEALHISTTSELKSWGDVRHTGRIDEVHLKTVVNAANDLKKFAAHTKYEFDPCARDFTREGYLIYKLMGSSMSNDPDPRKSNQIVTSCFSITVMSDNSSPIYSVTAAVPTGAPKAVEQIEQYMPAPIPTPAEEPKTSLTSAQVTSSELSLPPVPNQKPRSNTSSSGNSNFFKAIFNKNSPRKKGVDNQPEPVSPPLKSTSKDSSVSPGKASTPPIPINYKDAFSKELKEVLIKRNTPPGK
ncbi:hypothetical protein [Candidatus Odyssella acanthamoebae]|uniref:Uncharacterized protein n=1 Tax=Candidatus Odyssella acanthamoebae TaxID=91604 RepID=A0A077ATV9_9PROT|nr:hypothetical protein [Candidatus Paracaedibacter acanthamoebae]AIK95831.1 hypothetical protein ID47_02405 [Candidatus Paracaedibacter acanthamoebae]